MSHRFSEQQQQVARRVLQAIGVDLTPEFDEVLFDGAREKIVFGGWRAGKSTEGACEIAIDAFVRLAFGQKALYWLVGPDYGQTEQEFGYLRDWFSRFNLIVNSSAPLEGPRFLEIKGGIRVETKSAQYPERLGAVAPDLILCCEAGQISDEVRLWLTGRTMEKRGRIIYTGTLEDEHVHKQWAWYIELGSQWLEDRNEEHSAYSLPSWANRKVFPGGREDPEILRQEAAWREFTGSDFVFLRKIAGRPTGIQYQVYPQLDEVDLLLPIPEGTHFRRSFGGIDYGTVHPSSLAVLSLTANDVLWVREVVNTKKLRDKGDSAWIKQQHERLKRTYNCWEWGADPNEKFLARAFEAKAVSGSAGAREARVGLLTARLNTGRLYFDRNGPGVAAAYDEMHGVHRKKLRSGEIVLDRIDDDDTAAIEDAVEVCDGKRQVAFPMSFKGARRVLPKRTYQRVRV